MSQVWKYYEKLMSDKAFVKEAAEKDKDYDVKIPSAGPDTKVEKDGWELVELAHPEQVQVANSRLNDGIVENDVETKKIMLDVAFRNSRGVLAEVIQTLVKVANALEEDLTEESLKLAKDVDDVIEKIAQEAPTKVRTVGDGSTTEGWGMAGAGATAGAALLLASPPGWLAAVAGGLAAAIYAVNQKFDGLYAGFDAVAGRLESLDFGYVWSTSPAEKAIEQKVLNIAAELRKFAMLPVQLDDEKQAPELLRKTYNAIQYVNKQTGFIDNALKQATDWGLDKRQAMTAWNKMVEYANAWLQSMDAQIKADPALTPPASPKSEDKASPQVAPGVAVKAPSNAPAAKKTPSERRYSVYGPEVMELQKAVGLGGKDIDGKFGPQTFAAVMQESKDNYDLRTYLHDNPALVKGYEHWTDENVGNVLARIYQFKRGPGAAPNVAVQAPSPPLVSAPDTKQLAKEQLGVHAVKYPNADFENGLLYPKGKNENPDLAYRRTGKGWEKV